jgi:hypothetical protein
MIYKRDKKHAILKENPMINFRDISKIVADQWREETDEIKEHYKNLAKIEMKNHQEKYPDYRFPSSKGKHSKKKASKLQTALTQEMKKSVGRPKKLPSALSQDKSEKLQEYIKKLKSINGIQFQDSVENSQSENFTSQVFPGIEKGFTAPDTSDAIFKHRVLPPLVQNRGYLTPVKSEYFIPMKNAPTNSAGSPGNIYSTPTHTPMNRNMPDQQMMNVTLGMSSPIQQMNRVPPQTFSSPVQHMNRNIPVGGHPISPGAQQITQNVSVSPPLINRNLPVPGNMFSATAQPMNRNMQDAASAIQNLSSPVRQMNRGMPVQQIVTGTQQMNPNLPFFGNMAHGSQQLPVTLAQQQQMNRTFSSPVVQQGILNTASVAAGSIPQISSSGSLQNVRNSLLVTDDQKDVVKVEEMNDGRIQRVGTPSTPGYNSYSPISPAPLMATPEQSPQNFMERGQFRNVKPMAISEISDSPNRVGNLSYVSNVGLDQSQIETSPNSPKRGRPRGASSPGQQFSFLCELCSSSFVRKHDLKRHLLLHSGLGPYRCSCGRHFSRQDFFARHMQTCRSKSTLSPPESPALSVDEFSTASQP